MPTLDTQTWIMIAVVIVALLAIAAWFVYQRTQSRKLQERFGPEYDRTVDRLGSQTKAEAELRAREKRVEKFNIVPLARAEATRLSQSWNALQQRFVADPKGAVVQADALVRELMQKRGFPMGDFERRAAEGRREAERVTNEADRLTWDRYWRTRPRRNVPPRTPRQNR